MQLLLVLSSMKYFEERSRIASDIENTRFMMFLPATSEETYAYIKKCEIQWEIAKSLGVKTMMAQCDGYNIGSWPKFCTDYFANET